MARLSSDDFARLLAFRTTLRRFEHWSAGQARAAGLTPMQHQLLLAIKGHADPRGPTIGEIAEYLLVRPHSAVELVDRGEAAGLVVRKRSDNDARVVRVQLTPDASRRLSALTSLHVAELRRFGPILRDLTNAVKPTPD